MDDFHRRLVEIGLSVTSGDGFALAGGHAVNAHDFIERRSIDVDLFGSLKADVTAACAKVANEYRANGLQVEIEHEGQYYVRMIVRDPETSQESKVELVADVRLKDPVQMEIGPVLHADDVAAGKVEALCTRAECRDFIDVEALLRSGRYSREQLPTLAGQRDAGFDRRVFADMLAGVDRFPDAEFARYDVSSESATAIRTVMHAWRRDLLT